MKIKYIFRRCMALQTTVLLSTTICTFFMAQCLSAFLEAVNAQQYQHGCVYLFKIAAIMMTQLIISFIQKRYLASIISKQINQLECSIYAKYLQTSVQLSNESELTVICSKDIPQIAGYYTSIIPKMIQSIIGVMIYSGFFALQQGGWSLLGILTVLSLFQFLPPLITEKYLIKNYIRAGQEESQVQQQVLSGIEGIHTIKMLGIEGWFMGQFLSKQHAFRKTGERAAATSSFQSALNSGVSLIQQIGLLVVGLVGVSCGWFSLGVLIEGYIISSSFYQYAAHLGSFKVSRGMYRAAWQRVETVCATPEATQERMHYRLDFEFPSNGRWLIKGENGSGKTTLFTVFCGLLPQDEQIKQHGKILDRKTRKEIISWCPQMYLDFAESFYELLTLIPEQLLDRAQLQEYLTHFSVSQELLNKPLNQLSGGEQKRVILSLTLAKKGNIVLLDEPEVSLDQKSVHTLCHLLKKDERLIMLISHNPIFDDIVSGVINIQGGSISG